jgi:hypothetical protein
VGKAPAVHEVVAALDQLLASSRDIPSSLNDQLSARSRDIPSPLKGEG